ncbi:MAG: hypothetical protein U0793_11285 [Gemmataceae bacterium]
MTNKEAPQAQNATDWWYEEFDDDITGNEPFIIREARESAGPAGHVRAIATVMLTDSREAAEATAAFIVRACNTHEDLVHACNLALEEILQWDEVMGGSEDPRTRETIDALKTAIGKAHEKAA